MQGGPDQMYAVLYGLEGGPDQMYIVLYGLQGGPDQMYVLWSANKTNFIKQADLYDYQLVQINNCNNT